MPKSKLIILPTILMAAILALLLVFYPGLFTGEKPRTALENTKALIGGPFSLTDHHGKTVTEADFKGKYMLIYFGYTYCPDVCPTELQIMADALDRVPPETLAEVVPLFISVDPARDSIEILAQYAPAFHPNMVGLTGTPDQVKTVKKAYRVYSAIDKVEEGADPQAYLVSHTSYTYLMDRNGEYVTHFTSQTDPEVMAKRLQDIIG
ncbi:SCO family protein [Paremcibacter congregatus]|uniref:SCO family protein n=1 Tax=Paremcibacter congregatus TaxID=2043170 RepID=A0A2G4YPC8_9PROT|nr:SCO family protein [Paremcibacter congregatus]PHZ84155.1 SCO family protein [Paremcibacter congregatus]QDE25785.1 SCO family protein [Paremcibacter congregatus]|tara:strand:+ start:283 stop:903 length:621 start_codon:yes stop_codon:yes gene_type:complete